MKISLNETKQTFDFLIEEDKIWDGIEYLMGVDLKDADGSYLHSKESFIQYKKEKDF